MAKDEKTGVVVMAMASIGLALTCLGSYTMLRTPDLRPYRDVPGGDVERGRKALEQYKSGSCHKIAGVEGANGTRGQSLAGLALRNDIVGALPNTPEDVVHWIRDPKSVYPETAMPNLNVSQREAHDMVSNLFAVPP